MSIIKNIIFLVFLKNFNKIFQKERGYMKRIFIFFLNLFIFFEMLLSSEKLFRFLDIDLIYRIDGKEKITKSEFEKIEGYKIYYDNKKRPILIEVCFKGKLYEKEVFCWGPSVSKIEISYTDTFVNIEGESLLGEKMVYKFFDRKDESIKIFNDAYKIIFITLYKKNQNFEKIISYFENYEGKKIMDTDSVLLKITSIFKNKNSKRWDVGFYNFDENGKIVSSSNILGFEKIVRNENLQGTVDSLKIFNREEYIVLNTEKIQDDGFFGIKSLKIKKYSETKLQKFYEIIFFDDIGYEFKRIYLDTLLKPFDMDSNFAIRIIKRNSNFTYDRVEYFSSDTLLKTKMPPSIKYYGYPLFKVLTKKFVYDKENNLLGIEKIE